MRRAIFFLIAAGGLVWSGCSSTKSVPANDKLYTGATVQLKNIANTRERRALQEDVDGLTRPKPNSKFLGMRLKLGIYNMFYKKKPKSFWGKIRDKYGQPPVLLSQVDVAKNAQTIQTYLFNKGYFNALVTGDTVVRRKTAKAEYKAPAGERYTIDTIHSPTDSSALAKTIRESMDKSLLVKGKGFDLDVIKGERTRIDAYLKERGFYYFNPDYILVRTDSTVGDHLTNLYITVKPGTPLEAQQTYSINNVYIYTNYSLNTAHFDTSKSNAEFYKGYYIVQQRKFYKPKLLAESMQFDQGDIYNRR